MIEARVDQLDRQHQTAENLAQMLMAVDVATNAVAGVEGPAAE